MRTSLLRRLPALAVATATISALAVGAGPKPAHAFAPLFFPNGFGETSTSYTLRLAGVDRYATAGAGGYLSAVAQNTKSGWPFNSPDPTTKITAFGGSSCPKTVILVASDGLPDALAASPLRGLAAVPINGHTFDFTNSLLMLTDTARPPLNGTDLNLTTKTALDGIKASCGVFNALILGGTNAVPPNVEGDLAGEAGTVARVSGLDRFDTAAQIATLVRNDAGLAKIQHWPSLGATPVTLTDTVVLADGITGADALAIGPLAADLNAPILLATSATKLPVPTANALGALKPANILIIGGTGPIPDDTATSAGTAAGSSTNITRIAGADRYDTSVQIAQQLDNIWPGGQDTTVNAITGDSAIYSNQGFAFARSEGSGADHAGWPDALSAAMVMENLWKATTSPSRVAPPVELNLSKPPVMLGGTKGPNRFPLLLVQSTNLPTPVDNYLKGVYDFATVTGTCTSGCSGSTADDGGFGYVFGGPNAVQPAVELSVAEDLSGGTYTSTARTDLQPTLTQSGVFYTGADLTGYQSDPAGDGGVATGSAMTGDKICAVRGAVAGTQFFNVYNSLTLLQSFTVPYQPSGTAYAKGKNITFCVSAAGTTAKAAVTLGISPSGTVSNVITKDWSNPNNVVTTGTPGTSPAPSSFSESSPPSVAGNSLNPTPGIDNPAGPTGPTVLTLHYNAASLPVVYRGTSYPNADVNITLTRTSAADGSSEDSLVCTGNLTERTSPTGSTAFIANFTGDAVAPNGPFPAGGLPVVGGTANVVACVGAYGIGGNTGMIHFKVTGDGSKAALSDLVLDGST